MAVPRATGIAWKVEDRGQLDKYVWGLHQEHVSGTTTSMKRELFIKLSVKPILEKDVLVLILGVGNHSGSEPQSGHTHLLQQVPPSVPLVGGECDVHGVGVREGVGLRQTEMNNSDLWTNRA